MSRFLVSALGAAMVLSVFSSLVLAGQPDPTTSTWDERLGVSPKNTRPAVVASTVQYFFDGILRDDQNTPIPNYPATQVALDLTSCANPSSRTLSLIPPDAASDVNGKVEWRTNLNFGGGDPCVVRILVDNVLFKTLPADGAFPALNVAPGDGGVRSMDQNGSGTITVADLAVYRIEANNSGVRHDFRGDLSPGGTGSGFSGTTTVADLAAYRIHANAI